MILTVGCSWTFGTGVEADETYSAHLQDKLNIPVVNAGHAGIDIPYSIWSAYRLLHIYKPKLIIFQLTTFDRLTYSTGGYQNFLSKKLHSLEEQPVWTNEGNHIRVNGITEDSLQRLTQGSYLDSLGNKSQGNITNKFLFENYVYSDVKTDMIHMQLDMFQNYAESNNAKVLFFPWLPLEKEIVKRSIVDIRRDSAVEYLGDTYFIDKGFHISSAGHKTLAEEYIYPMIRSNFE